MVAIVAVPLTVMLACAAGILLIGLVATSGSGRLAESRPLILSAQALLFILLAALAFMATSGVLHLISQ
jgi:hypothetical protein